jgi:glycosyltransferase involved in cell wall biosynthesis
MKILYINHYAGSIYHGMEYRPYYLSLQWIKMGHSVSIIASNFSHLRSNVSIKKPNNYKIEYIDGIKYIWCRTNIYKTNGIKRLFSIVKFLYRIWNYRNVLIKENFDIIIASSTYPFDTYIAKYLANKTHAKFIYEVHDLWPLTPMELNKISSYHPIIWLMAKAEKYGYKKADLVVSLLINSFDYMKTKGLEKSKFRYVPNGIFIDKDFLLSDGLNLLDLNMQILITKMRENYNFLVGYCGGMGESNALKFLLKTAMLLPDVGFILVGDGMLKEQLTIDAKNIPNILILSSIKKNQVNNFLQQMDLLYIGWNNFNIYKFGVCPNKIFDYMLAKIPILHSINQDNDIVSVANCGLKAKAEDPVDIANKINQIKQITLAKRLELGENGYKYVIKNHLYQDLAVKFIEDIQNV